MFFVTCNTTIKALTIVCLPLSLYNYLGSIIGVDAQTLTELTSSTPIWCIGDIVNYTCSVQSDAHTWIAGSFGDENVVRGDTINAPTPIRFSPYTLFLLARSSNAIQSSLTAVAFADFNNTEISCRDGLAINVQNSDRQHATAMVYGELVN